MDYALQIELYLRRLHTLILICSNKFSPILWINFNDGKYKLWIFYQEHTNTIRKNILVITNQLIQKNQNSNHKNEIKSNTFRQQWHYRKQYGRKH